jgi:hypothetical protein
VGTCPIGGAPGDLGVSIGVNANAIPAGTTVTVTAQVDPTDPSHPTGAFDEWNETNNSFSQTFDVPGGCLGLC